MTKAKHRSLITGVIEDAIRLYGRNFSLTLEEYFTQLSAMLEMVGSAPIVGKFSSASLEAMRSRLLDALAAVLEESADVTLAKSAAVLDRCKYHRALVDALQPGDSIISFNYDCVIDDALRTYGDGKWSAKHGYHFGGIVPKDWECWSPNTVVGPKKTIRLLKLHGSLNWFPFSSPDRVDLRQRTYKQNQRQHYEIVPPQFIKKDDHDIRNSLWMQAGKDLSKAGTIVFVGFSFTPTDLHVEALFRLALASGSNARTIIVANPNDEHRRRIRSIVMPGSKPETRVIQFASFEELATPLPGLLASSRRKP